MICPNCKMEIQPVEEISSEISLVKDEQGRMKTWTEITRDSDGNQIRKRVDEYTYHSTGEVDTITQQVFDSADKLTSEAEVKH